MGRAATSVYAREGTDVAINYPTEGPDAKEVVDLVRVGGRKRFAFRVTCARKLL
jgi:hypothetical protein